MFGVEWNGFLFISFFIIFILILGMFVYGIVKSFANSRKKNHASPYWMCRRRWSVNAPLIPEILSLLMQRPFHTSEGITRYWITFQFPSGDRSEFAVTGQEYGLLAEGDDGILRFREMSF